MENLELIKLKINSISKNFTSSKYLEKAKKQRIEFYTNSLDMVNTLSTELIEKHNFKIEILDSIELIEKTELFFKKIYPKIDKLEIHKYSPEQNKLIFKNNSILKIPGIDTIEKACSYLISNLSLEQIQKYFK